MSFTKKLALLPRSLKLLTAMGAALAFGSMAHAQADPTDAGVVVSNTFTLDYSVNDVPQPEINNNDDPTDFTVDRLIDLTVVQTNSPQTVAPGTLAADAELTFQVTNTGNDNQSYTLSLDAATLTDFVLANQVVTITYADGSTQTVNPVALGAAAGAGDFTVDIPAGEAFTVTVAGDIPAGALNADINDIALLVETREPSAYVVAASTAPTAGAVVVGANGGTNVLESDAQNVFADDDADGAASFPTGDLDAAENGVGVDVGRFIVATPNVTGEKTVEVVSSDGSSCPDFTVAPSNTEFAIPGACVEYVITVTNLGADDPDGNPIPGDTIPATDVVVADILPDELIFVSAIVEDFTGTAPAPSAAQPLPAASTACDGTAATCLVRFEGGAVSAPGNSAADPTVARVRIRALIE